MNDVKINRSYFAIIPANVRYDERLTPNAKLLYGEITALCNEKGFCWASNNYFSSLYKVSKTSISKWISALAECGYISIELIYKEGTKQILNRYLRIVNDPIEEKLNTPIEEKLKDNNTINNNTINNTNNKKERKKSTKKNTQKSFDELIENYTLNTDLQNELKNHLATRKAKKAALTNRAIELALKKLDELTKNEPVNEQEEIKLKIVQQSIERGWIGFFALQNNTTNKFYKNQKNSNDGWEYLNEEFDKIYNKEPMPF